MTPERWQQIERIYHRALEIDARERDAYVQQTCAGDEALRHEVDSLLREVDQTSNFLDRPALEVAAQSCAVSVVPDLAGRRLGHYELISLLGAGGMGEVYRARDARLGRIVAVKVLTSLLAERLDLRHRFEREARAVSNLNHPHICTLHDVGRHDGIDYLVMECLEGETLASRIKRGGLPLDQLLRYAIETADALGHAHSHGVIHRDLKPGNIMLTQSGTKLLDFGLAKVRDTDSSAMATGAGAVTREGAVVGTLHYMAPEQVRGEEPDERTDLFALGATLYEMATGQQAFPGKTAGIVFDAILNRAPAPVTSLNSGFPAKLEAIIGKALQKDREMRYQSATELRADLHRLMRGDESGIEVASRLPPPTMPGGRLPRRYLLASALVATVMILALTWPVWRPFGGRAELIERRLTTNSSEAPVNTAAISPDGKYLAYVDQTGPYLRSIGSTEVHAVTVPADTRIVALSWFPDGSRLLASGYSGRSDVSSAWSIAIPSGTVRKIRDNAEQANVSPDGAHIAFTGEHHTEVWLMGPNGEHPHRIQSAQGEYQVSGMVWSADGLRLAYIKFHSGIDKLETTIESSDLEGRDRFLLVSDPLLASNSILAPAHAWLDHRLIYARAEPAPRQGDANLWEIRTHGRTGHPTGSPRRLTNWSGFSAFGLSATADGKRMVYLRGQGQADVYVADVEASRRSLSNVRRLTLNERDDVPYSWTPDSHAVLFASDRNGTVDIFKQGIDQRTAEAIVAGPENENTPRVSPDGAWVLYQAYPKSTDVLSAPKSIYRKPLAGGQVELVSHAGFGANIRCSRSSAVPCVLNERDSNGKQLLFYVLDPMRGKGRELTSMNADLTRFYNWDISPDGSRVAVAIPPGQPEGHIRILPIGGGKVGDLTLRDWQNLESLDWSPDGRGWYISNITDTASTLLYVDLQGHATPLGQDINWAVPSPDGRHLALSKVTVTSNAWMIENF